MDRGNIFKEAIHESNKDLSDEEENAETEGIGLSS